MYTHRDTEGVAESMEERGGSVCVLMRADEKSTFERLVQSFTVNKQPLLHPKRLANLTHMDQQVRSDLTHTDMLIYRVWAAL